MFVVVIDSDVTLNVCISFLIPLGEVFMYGCVLKEEIGTYIGIFLSLAFPGQENCSAMVSNEDFIFKEWSSEF